MLDYEIILDNSIPDYDGDVPDESSFHLNQPQYIDTMEQWVSHDSSNTVPDELNNSDEICFIYADEKDKISLYQNYITENVYNAIDITWASVVAYRVMKRNG